MVLGLSAKTRKGATVQVDYLIHIQEIKPWPPSQSLRSLRSVLIQWENGDRSTGSTKTVVPSLGSVVGEGKIEFNESFRLPVTLVREMSVKGRDADAFHRNSLEFNLYERRRDKNQLLASAILDLAEYGIVREALSTSVSMNCKRSFSNTAQPILFINIQPIDKGRGGSSSRGSLSKETLLDKNGGESVSALMNEEYTEEAEIASLTDDDVSSHSSLTVSSSTVESNGVVPTQNVENGSEMDGKEGVKRQSSLASKLQLDKSELVTKIRPSENHKVGSSCSSSIDLSSDHESQVDGHASVSNSCGSSSPAPENVATHNIHSSALSLTNETMEEKGSSSMRSNDCESLTQEVDDVIANNGTAVRRNSYSKGNVSGSFQEKVVSSAKSSQSLGAEDSCSIINGEEDGKTSQNGKRSHEASVSVDIYGNSMRNLDRNNSLEKGGYEKQNLEGKEDSSEDELLNIYPQDGPKPQFVSDTLSLGQGNLGIKTNILKSDRLRHVKSVRSSSDSTRTNGLLSNNQHTEGREACSLGDAQHGDGTLRGNERRSAKVYPKDFRSSFLDNKVQQLEHRMKMLEGELREAAAIEAALYSVVAEHGSSMSKVHAPARRLSRLYLHVCREGIKSRRASAARSAVSGLVLVAKACGNDVPRLTFWLSNCVVLRAIISQNIGDSELALSAGPLEKNGVSSRKEGSKQASSLLKWKESSPSRKENKNLSYGSLSDWEAPNIFTSALERVEAWTFSRIIESVWWQTLTPHMQTDGSRAVDGGCDSGSRKNYGRSSSSCNQDQMNFSLDHWKKAFKDACERLCPVRAAGHECGCLPVLARLIMEQCVARLDVAMFNAILRESDDEIPTDPVSDPISDSTVLPIPAGKTSFGAGAQLKNAIGNWSRWLSDFFGIDDDDAPQDENGHGDNSKLPDTTLKPFHLLNALSDLMMLPKDMLLSKSIRKEVCPTFGAPLIKRVLDNFVPDEFCPDQVPDVVLEALDTEDVEEGEGTITNFPCIAAPPVYSPPSAASVACIIEVGGQPQLRRSASSVIRKSYTSDDELDELNSPLASIFIDGFRSSVQSTPSWESKGKSNQKAIRYELLQDIWMNSE